MIAFYPLSCRFGPFIIRMLFVVTSFTDAFVVKFCQALSVIEPTFLQACQSNFARNSETNYTVACLVAYSGRPWCLSLCYLQVCNHIKNIQQTLSLKGAEHLGKVFNCFPFWLCIDYLFVITHIMTTACFKMSFIFVRSTFIRVCRHTSSVHQ